MATVPENQFATLDDIRRIERELAEIRKLLEKHTHDLHIQLTRIAQLQGDLDVIRGAWTKIKPGNDLQVGPDRRDKSR